MRLLLLLLGALRAAANNGYSLHFTGSGSIAGTKSQLLDSTNSEIARLTDGFTTMEWILFEDVNPSAFNPPLIINTHLDSNFYQPFGGVHGGFQFGGGAPPSVSTLSDSGTTWHHYTQSYDRVSGVLNMYIDGQFLSTTTKSGYTFMDQQPYMLIGMHCYETNYLLSDYTECNRGFQLSGRIDEVAVFAGAMSASDIAARFDQSLATRIRSGLEPNLIVFYDFENVAYDATYGVDIAPNLGTAGTGYDLLLGKLPKPTGAEIFGTSYNDGSGTIISFVAPKAVPQSDSTAWAVPKAQDSTAPLVVTAAPGETISISGSGVSTTYTAPNPFTATASFVSSGVTVHVVPVEAPVPPFGPFLSVTGLEDASVALRLWGSHGTGLDLEAVIVSEPTKGTLYQIAHCTSTVQEATLGNGSVTDATGLCVMYIPQPDAYGEPYDTFSFQTRYKSQPSYPSPTVTITLTVRGSDDLPTSVVTNSSYAISIQEDDGAQLIELNATDAEAGTPLDLYISALPTKGKLYLTSDGTLAGARTEITTTYSFFDVGSDVQGQYVHSVRAVSSYWPGTASGSPVYAGYHALNILGPPDCNTYGECGSDTLMNPWLADAGPVYTLYPPIGQRVMHSGLFAWVDAYNVSAGTVDLIYHPVYKANASGELQKCFFPIPNVTYPTDCDFGLVPASGVVTGTVARSAIAGMDSGVWCPKKKGYTGNLVMAGGGTFGPEYVYSHNQDDVYLSSTPKYTEWIEVSLETPAYVASVEIGMPRGMGHVVAIRAWDPTALAWVALYTGDADLEVAAAYAETREYYRWAPDTCRVHFRVTHLRIEVDTSVETGIADWNYIDYVRVYGSLGDIQSAALRTGVNKVVYVPDADEYGADAFSFHATDCPGSLLRSSAESVVAIAIGAVNDAPAAVTQTIDVSVDTTTTLTVLGVTDVDSSSLLYTVSSVPSDVTLTDGAGAAVVAGTTLSGGELTVFSAVCGGHAVAFSVSDGALSGSATTTVNVVCPPTCSEGDMVFTVSECGDDLKRTATWAWSNSTTCDLPRARALLEDVNIDCDYVGWDTPAAVGIVAIVALVVLFKLGLLVFFIVERAAPVMRLSQSTYGVLCICGGMMADLTPLTLLGELSDSRCHMFPSWLLLSVSLLYGPLVVKTWKVWKVFDNPSLKELNLKNSRLFSYLALALLLEVVISIVFAFVQPVEAVEYNYTFSGGYGDLLREKCSDENTVFHILAYAIVALPLMGGLYLAFKTRKVSGDYTDNKAILGSMYTLLIAVLVVIPVTGMIEDTLFTFVLVSVACLLVSTTSVATFTVPKILLHRGLIPTASIGPNNTMTQSTSDNNRPSYSEHGADEIEELKSELSELREANMELKQRNAELMRAAAPAASEKGEDPGSRARVDPGKGA